VTAIALIAALDEAKDLAAHGQPVPSRPSRSLTLRTPCSATSAGGLLRERVELGTV